jgi:hypothetical protein
LEKITVAVVALSHYFLLLWWLKKLIYKTLQIIFTVFELIRGLSSTSQRNIVKIMGSTARELSPSDIKLGKYNKDYSTIKLLNVISKNG